MYTNNIINPNPYNVVYLGLWSVVWEFWCLISLFQCHVSWITDWGNANRLSFCNISSCNNSQLWGHLSLYRDPLCYRDGIGGRLLYISTAIHRKTWLVFKTDLNEWTFLCKLFDYHCIQKVSPVISMQFWFSWDANQGCFKLASFMISLI